MKGLEGYPTKECEVSPLFGKVMHLVTLSKFRVPYLQVTNQRLSIIKML